MDQAFLTLSEHLGLPSPLERLGNSENTMDQAEIKAKKCKRDYSPVRNYDQSKVMYRF